MIKLRNISSLTMNNKMQILIYFALILVLSACGGTPEETKPVAETTPYLIGPGDNLKIFVWRHKDLSVTVPVRPDGKISTPLVEDMVAVGKTPTQLARDIEKVLSEYVRTPKVNVIIEKFVGQFNQQIRVVGEAEKPRALSYRKNITLLDVMIEVGGLSENASGNRAKIIRRAGDGEQEIKVRIKDLLDDGDTSQNLIMHPGDIVIIPETWF